MKGSRSIVAVILLVSLIILTACGNPLTKLIGGKEDTSVSIILQNEQLGDGTRETVLYYRDEKGLLIPVMKKIPWEEGIAKSALRQLVDQPALREDLARVGLLPVLPPGTDVLGMSIDGGLAKVDFNNQLLSYSTKVDEDAIVKSIVYTLTEFPSIDKVQLMVNGKVMKSLTYGTKVGMPLERENINLAQELREEAIPIVVYYKGTTNGEDSFYVPVTMGIHALRADVKSVLAALLEGSPEEIGLYSEIPAGTQLNDVYVKDGIAYIDFTEEIKNIPQNERLQQSLVYELGFTLREVEPTITQVRILSGGKEIGLNSGVKLNLPVFSNTY